MWGGVFFFLMKGTWRRTHANIPQVFVDIRKEQLLKGHVVLDCAYGVQYRTELGKEINFKHKNV